MILCDSATQTVNLYYSVLKFLQFKGIIWSGDGLPLVINSLGELFQANLDLRDQDGVRVKDVAWDRGTLHAHFDKNKKYDLSMRLEYTVPPTTDVFHSDFLSIHPKHYTVALDFSTHNYLGHDYNAQLQLGDHIEHMNLAEPTERRLSTGHSMKLFQQEDYVSFSVSAAEDQPFGHRHFPTLSVTRPSAEEAA